MSWTEIRTDDEPFREWEREDGWATLRLRRRSDGSWVVRLDRLTQAPEGSLYHEERAETETDAVALVDSWKETYDVVDDERLVDDT